MRPACGSGERGQCTAARSPERSHSPVAPRHRTKWPNPAPARTGARRRRPPRSKRSRSPGDGRMALPPTGLYRRPPTIAPPAPAGTTEAAGARGPFIPSSSSPHDPISKWRSPETDGDRRPGWSCPIAGPTRNAHGERSCRPGPRPVRNARFQTERPSPGLSGPRRSGIMGIPVHLYPAHSGSGP